MVVAVMSGPPENAFLGGGHGHPGDDELKPPAGFKRAVREIAVIAGSDEEHADFVEQQAGDEIRPVKMYEENAECGKVKERERERRNQLDARPVRQRDRERGCDGRHSAQLLRVKTRLRNRVARKNERIQRNEPRVKVYGESRYRSRQMRTGLGIRV